jgi:hypothetical protein
MDGLPYFYQRTVYLENLCQPGSWWSNPAMIAGADRMTLFTSNSGMIGTQYFISSIRLLFPDTPSVVWGLGITGAGTSAGQSLSGSGSGAQSTGSFSFSRPSLEAGISYSHPYIGSLGAIVLTGSESNTDMLSYFFGVSAGYLSPSIMQTVKFSFSTLSTRHVQVVPWWDNSAKAGLQVTIDSGLVLGSLEYGFPLGASLSAIENESTFSYETICGRISLRFKKIAGLILAYSHDTPNWFDNGSTYHAGLELRKSDIFPYYGGYEIAYTTSHSLAFIHRIWIGYGFQKK